MQEKNIFADYSLELQWFLSWLNTKNGREVLATPHVKSTKTTKMSLRGVSYDLKTGKITDPSC